jgi:hypothetical protein
MARLYSVAIASLAIEAPIKWTDNLLSQHDVRDVRRRTRGVARGISWPALRHIALTRELHLRLGCSVRDALDMAGRLLDAPVPSANIGASLVLGLDREGFERALRQRLVDALEMAPQPRRGRPPRRSDRAE